MENEIQPSGMHIMSEKEAKDRYLKNGSCSVCQSHMKFFSDASWKRHLASEQHKKRALVDGFLMRTTDFQKATDETKSVLLPSLESEWKPLLGKNHLHEFFLKNQFVFWVCSCCNLLNTELDDCLAHLISQSHRLEYLNRFHPDKKPKGKTAKDIADELQSVTFALKETAAIEKSQIFQLQSAEVLKEFGIELSVCDGDQNDVCSGNENSKKEILPIPVETNPAQEEESVAETTTTNPSPVSEALPIRSDISIEPESSAPQSIELNEESEIQIVQPLITAIESEALVNKVPEPEKVESLQGSNSNDVEPCTKSVDANVVVSQEKLDTPAASSLTKDATPLKDLPPKESESNLEKKDIGYWPGFSFDAENSLREGTHASGSSKSDPQQEKTDADGFEPEVLASSNEVTRPDATPAEIPESQGVQKPEVEISQGNNEEESSPKKQEKESTQPFSEKNEIEKSDGDKSLEDIRNMSESESQAKIPVVDKPTPDYDGPQTKNDEMAPLAEISSAEPAHEQIASEETRLQGECSVKVTSPECNKVSGKLVPEKESISAECSPTSGEVVTKNKPIHNKSPPAGGLESETKTTAERKSPSEGKSDQIKTAKKDDSKKSHAPSKSSSTDKPKSPTVDKISDKKNAKTSAGNSNVKRPPPEPKVLSSDRDEVLVWCDDCWVTLVIDKAATSVKAIWAKHLKTTGHLKCCEKRRKLGIMEKKYFVEVEASADVRAEMKKIKKAVGQDYLIERHGTRDNGKGSNEIVCLLCASVFTVNALPSHMDGKQHIVQFLHKCYPEMIRKLSREPFEERGKMMNDFLESKKMSPGKIKVYDPCLAKLIQAVSQSPTGLGSQQSAYESDKALTTLRNESLLKILDARVNEVKKGSIGVAKEISACQAPLVGLQYVQELLSDSEETHPSYICRLCPSWETNKSLLHHLASQKHRLNFFDKAGYKHYRQNVEGDQNEAHRAGILKQYAQKLETQLGRGAITKRLSFKIPKKSLHKLWPSFNWIKRDFPRNQPAPPGTDVPKRESRPVKVEPRRSPIPPRTFGGSSSLPTKWPLPSSANVIAPKAEWHEATASFLNKLGVPVPVSNESFGNEPAPPGSDSISRPLTFRETVRPPPPRSPVRRRSDRCTPERRPKRPKPSSPPRYSQHRDTRNYSLSRHHSRDGRSRSRSPPNRRLSPPPKSSKRSKTEQSVSRSSNSKVSESKPKTGSSKHSDRSTPATKTKKKSDALSELELLQLQLKAIQNAKDSSLHPNEKPGQRLMMDLAKLGKTLAQKEETSFQPKDTSTRTHDSFRDRNFSAHVPGPSRMSGNILAPQSFPSFKELNSNEKRSETSIPRSSIQPSAVPPESTSQDISSLLSSLLPPKPSPASSNTEQILNAFLGAAGGDGSQAVIVKLLLEEREKQRKQEEQQQALLSLLTQSITQTQPHPPVAVSHPQSSVLRQTDTRDQGAASSITYGLPPPKSRKREEIQIIQDATANVLQSRRARDVNSAGPSELGTDQFLQRRDVLAPTTSAPTKNFSSNATPNSLEDALKMLANSGMGTSGKKLKPLPKPLGFPSSPPIRETFLPEESAVEVKDMEISESPPPLPTPKLVSSTNQVSQANDSVEEIPPPPPPPRPRSKPSAAGNLPSQEVPRPGSQFQAPPLHYPHPPPQNPGSFAQMDTAPFNGWFYGPGHPPHGMVPPSHYGHPNMPIPPPQWHYPPQGFPPQ